MLTFIVQPAFLNQITGRAGIPRFTQTKEIIPESGMTVGGFTVGLNPAIKQRPRS